MIEPIKHPKPVSALLLVGFSQSAVVLYDTFPIIQIHHFACPLGCEELLQPLTVVGLHARPPDLVSSGGFLNRNVVFTF